MKNTTLRSYALGLLSLLVLVAALGAAPDIMLNAINEKIRQAKHDYLTGNFKGARNNLSQAIKLAEFNRDRVNFHAKAQNLIGLGYLAIELKQYDEAISCADKVLKIYESMKGSAKQQLDGHLLKATALIEKGEPRKGMEIADEQGNKCIELKLSDAEMADCKMVSAMASLKLGDGSEAIVMAQIAQELYAKVPKTEVKQYKSVSFVGDIFLRAKQYDQGLENFKAAFNLAQNIPGNEALIFESLCDFGRTYICMEKYEEAVKQYEDALKWAEKHPKANLNQVACLGGIIVSLDKVGRTAEAEIKRKEFDKLVGPMFQSRKGK